MFYILLQFYFLILFFFFTDTSTTYIYTLSLHDALPILNKNGLDSLDDSLMMRLAQLNYDRTNFDIADKMKKYENELGLDRKSTRLNSSHQIISYAVFCLKKKKNKTKTNQHENEKKLTYT